jgi:hypothetical protein
VLKKGKVEKEVDVPGRGRLRVQRNVLVRLSAPMYAALVFEEAEAIQIANGRGGGSSAYG